MDALSASTDSEPEVVLKLDSTIPCGFQRVMAAVASSSLTIGENNRNLGMGRASLWFAFVFMPSFIIFSAAGIARILYDKVPGLGFPWCLPVTMLWGVYMAVLQAAMYHVLLFLPRAPLAAWEALSDVGMEKIGVAISVACAPVLYFDQAIPIVSWCCLVCLLTAAIVAFWVCLVRAYGK